MWQERKQEVPPAAARTAPVAPTTEPATPSRAGAFIGRSILIKGRIESQEDLYIDGEIQGTVDLPNNRLTIGPNGKAHAGTKAREIDVLGAIAGNVESTEKVCVRTGGSLVGDVKTAGIVIEDGAYFKGSIDIVKSVPIPIVDLAETRERAEPASAAALVSR